MSLADTVKKPAKKDMTPQEVEGHVNDLFPPEKIIIMAEKPRKVEKKKRPSIQLDEDHHQKLRIIAACKYMDIGKLLSSIVTTWLDCVDLNQLTEPRES